MGMFRKFSSSSYDKRSEVRVIVENRNPTIVSDFLVKKRIKKRNRKLKNRNPNPSNFKIQRYLQIKDYLIVQVKYPDCNNYEGNKILVYHGIDILDLKLQKSIDPHFSENKKYHSPIARFMPTERGWAMACVSVRAFLL